MRHIVQGLCASCAGVVLLAGPMVEGRQVAAPEPVAGVVVDEAGRPLGGVAVNAFMGDAAVTGPDGRFELKTPWPTMRFVVDGYAPVTRLASTVRTSGRVVLVAARTGPTVLPRCGPQHAIRPGVGGLRVPTFPKARRHQGEDIDYQTESWVYKGTALLHGWGPHWSGGLPSRILDGVVPRQFQSLDVPASGSTKMSRSSVERASPCRFATAPMMA